MSLFREKNASCNSWLMGNSYCMSSSVLILFSVSEKIVAVNIESFSVKSWVLLWVLGECVFCHLHLVHCVPSSSSSSGSWAITEASLGSVGGGLVARSPPGSGGGQQKRPWHSRWSCWPLERPSQDLLSQSCIGEAEVEGRNGNRPSQLDLGAKAANLGTHLTQVQAVSMGHVWPNGRSRTLSLPPPFSIALRDWASPCLSGSWGTRVQSDLSSGAHCSVAESPSRQLASAVVAVAPRRQALLCRLSALSVTRTHVQALQPLLLLPPAFLVASPSE